MRDKLIHTKSWWCLLFLLPIAVCSAATGKIIYVDDDATGTNNGSSWADAYCCLQNALGDAQSGDEIRVARGIYKPDREVVTGRDIRVVASGDRTVAFQLIDGVDIKGGYAGFSGPDPNERDISLYETILSGDLNGDDNNVNDPCELLTEPTRAENSYTVVTGSVDNCLLDGFTISGGNANGPMQTSPSAIADPSEYGWGGGMHLMSLNPFSVTITNCTFRNNSASGGGGGIFNLSGSGPTLDNCIFEWNSGGFVVRDNLGFHTIGGGGGMYNGEIHNRDNNPTLINCTFIENYAPTNGGGMYNQKCNATLTNCFFRRNSSGTVVVKGNTAIFKCGAGGGMYNSRSNATLTNCIFTANSTKERGGGIESTQSDLTLTNCTFSGNSAYNDFFSSCGGGINSLGEDTIILTNCTFVQNSAQYGNALCDYNLGLSSIELINCILWDGRQEISYNHNENVIKITYSNIQGGWSGEGGYNIDADPMFAVPGYWADVNDPNVAVEPNDPNAVWIDGDYHLKSQAGRWDPVSESWVVEDVTSPCIDAGDPNSPVKDEPEPNGSIINMGAYGGSSQASKSLSGLHAKYGGGTGEPNDPYLICTAEQMNTIGAEPNDWDKYFKLMADIDLKDFGDSSFNLIGSYSHPFKGVFDGNSHTISNLTYVVTGNEEPAEDDFIARFGLFRSIDDPNAIIRDLRLVNPDIRPASTCEKRLWNMGALVGSLGSGFISNCSIEGGQVQGERGIGGLTGSNWGTISDCYTTCMVGPAEQRSLPTVNEPFNRREFFGGLVGVNCREISNCHAVGEVSGEWTVGGLVGEAYGRISNSWSGSEVSGDYSIGGLIGMTRRLAQISHCYATGHVSGRRSVGGLVGYSLKNSSINSCYVTGSVSAEQEAGGLVGLHEGTLSECCSTAPVSAAFDTAGGLVGFNGGNIFTSLACGDVSGRNNIGGLVGDNKKWSQLIAGILFEYDGIVINSYAKGSAHGKRDVGGLIGNNTGTVLGCYSTGRITGDDNFGGLVGNNGDIPVVGSFWDTETSGLDTSSGGSGKTTTEMQTTGTFLRSGWDFVDEIENGTEDIWWILEGRDYPRLWWELIE